MGVGAAAFSANKDEMMPQGVSDIAPQVTADPALAERAENTSASLASFADVEGAKMNKGDIGFFGSQVAQTIGEATTAVFSFFRDTSEDGPEAEQSAALEEAQRLRPVPGPAVLTLG